jgi:hypothetical protein
MWDKTKQKTVIGPKQWNGIAISWSNLRVQATTVT